MVFGVDVCVLFISVGAVRVVCCLCVWLCRWLLVFVWLVVDCPCAVCGVSCVSCVIVRCLVLLIAAVCALSLLAVGSLGFLFV